MSLSKPTHEQLNRHVLFLQEQDGPSERELKAELSKCFTDLEIVQRAYLSRVQYEGAEGDFTVALCLSTAQTTAVPTLLEKIGSIFGAMFGRDEHLDVLLLRADQENQLSKVCLPFFVYE